MGGVLSRSTEQVPGQELREFYYTPGDFEHARRLLYQQAGISLSATKEQMVYSRLARRLRSLRLCSFADYFSYLEQHEEEWQQFINALTTNLTAFFREQHHFGVLEELLAAKRAQNWRSKTPWRKLGSKRRCKMPWSRMPTCRPSTKCKSRHWARKNIGCAMFWWRMKKQPNKCWPKPRAAPSLSRLQPSLHAIPGRATKAG